MLTSETLQLPSRLDEILMPILKEREVRLFLKRDDLIHSEISGNKWRKLKYNLTEAQNQRKHTILTYGGAYSNHIYATAAACKLFGKKSVGVIRGYNFPSLSHTLKFAESCGMTLKFTSKEEFSTRHKSSFKTILYREFGEFYDIPEGGANDLGAKGCEDIVSEIDIDFDTIAVACGTATTLRGVVNKLHETKMAIGFPALNHGESLNPVMNKSGKSNWKFVNDYTFGGYAKVTEKLLVFQKDFFKETNIELDFIYTSKMMYGLFDLIQKGYFPRRHTIIALHTGGVQGNASIRR